MRRHAEVGECLVVARAEVGVAVLGCRKTRIPSAAPAAVKMSQTSEKPMPGHRCGADVWSPSFGRSGRPVRGSRRRRLLDRKDRVPAVVLESEQPFSSPKKVMKTMLRFGLRS